MDWLGCHKNEIRVEYLRFWFALCFPNIFVERSVSESLDYFCLIVSFLSPPRPGHTLLTFQPQYVRFSTDYKSSAETYDNYRNIVVLVVLALPCTALIALGTLCGSCHDGREEGAVIQFSPCAIFPPTNNLFRVEHQTTFPPGFQ
jgi:hypothetical protein